MISTPGKMKLGYLSYGQSKSKTKQQDNSIEKSKVVFGNQNNDLFAGMDKRNLSYLESQIMQKQKEKRKAQKRLESQQKQQKVKQPDILNKQSSIENPTITEIDASQQETQRSQEDNVLIISSKQEKQQSNSDSKQLKTNAITDNQQERTLEQPYYEYLDGYIKSLEQLPSQKQKLHFLSHSRQESPFIKRNLSIKSSLKHSIQPSSSRFAQIQQQQNIQQYNILLAKYRKQNQDSCVLNQQFEEDRQLQQQQIKQIMRLQQEIELCSRSIQKFRKQKSKAIKKNNEIRQAILVSRHHVSSINSNKYKSKDQSLGYQQMSQYDTFKRFIVKERR